jgi:hypothetical protein
MYLCGELREYCDEKSAALILHATSPSSRQVIGFVGLESAKPGGSRNILWTCRNILSNQSLSAISVEQSTGKLTE